MERGDRPPYPASVWTAPPFPTARAHSRVPTAAPRSARLAPRPFATWTTVSSAARANRAPTPPTMFAPRARAPRVALPPPAPARPTLRALPANPAIFWTLASRQQRAGLARPSPVASRRSRARLLPIPNAHSAQREPGGRPPYRVSVRHAAPFPSARRQSRAPTPAIRPARLARADIVSMLVDASTSTNARTALTPARPLPHAPTHSAASSAPATRAIPATA